MASDSAVRIKILGDNSNFVKVINSTEASVKSLQGVLAKLGLSVGITKVVKDAISNTSALENSIAQASTLFGNVNVDVANLNKKLIEMSSATGLTADSIGTSLYNALSSGVEVTQDMGTALEFMEKTSKLAVAGFTSVENAVDAVAKIQNAYGQEAISVDEISKNLIMTQNLGITTVDQLSTALATVTPIASAFGVSFEEVGASLSVMTKAGTDTATATTQLRALISSLAQADTKASKALKEASKQATGQAMSFDQLKKEGYDLQKMLRMMEDYAQSTGVSLVDLFGEVRAGTGALQLASDATGTFSLYLEEMEKDADIVSDAYDKVMGTRSKQWELLGSRMRNLTINITQSEGSKKILDSVYSLAESIVNKFEEWEPTISRAINASTVITSVFFNYLKSNIEELPTWIVGAFAGASIISKITSSLGLTKLSTGAVGFALGLEILDGINGTKTWEQVGKELAQALAVGIGVGSFLGANAGSLAFALSLTLDPDYSDIGKKAGEIGNTLFDSLGTALSSVFGEGSTTRAVVQGFFDWVGDLWNASVSSIGILFEGLFNGDIKRSWQKSIDEFAMMWAKLFDMFKGGTNYQDMVKVNIAKRDIGVANFFDDDDLLKYIKEAEEKSIDLETYLKEIQKTQNEKAKEQIALTLGVDVETVEKQLNEITEKTIKDLSNGITGLSSDPTKNQNAWTNIMASYSSEDLSSAIFDGKSLTDLETSLNEANSIVETATEEMRKKVTEAMHKMFPLAGDTVEGFVNGLNLDELNEVGKKLGISLVTGTKEELEIHSPSKVYEEIGENITKGLENGLTESEIENLKTELNNIYSSLGATISQALASGFDEDGNAYTIADAIRDLYEGTSQYLSLGKKIDNIEVKETPSLTGSNDSGSSTSSSSGSGQEEKVSGLKKLWDSLGETIEDTEKTGFDAINKLSTAFMDLASSIGDYYSTMSEQQISALEQARDTAKENGDLTVEEEKEMNAQIKELKRKQFEQEKQNNIAQATMSGSLAILNIWKDWSGNPIIASVLTAAAGATLATQIATIKAQNSGYEHGGLIGGHGYTGDKQQIWANAGELILNRAQQRAIADQLSYGGTTTVLQVDFSGNVFGDEKTIAGYVYDAIKTAQSQGELRAW